MTEKWIFKPETDNKGNDKVIYRAQKHGDDSYLSGFPCYEKE